MPFELRSAIGLSLLGLLVPLVILYILKIRRQRLRVGSTWLWAAAARDLRARHPFKKLVVQVPLLLQAVALVALAVALSRPASRGEGIVGDHVAIIIDTSASMTAGTANGSTRLAEARRAAHEVVDGLGPGAEGMILDAGSTPRVVSPLDRDRRRLHEAVNRVGAREARGNLGEAIALARDRLQQLSGRSHIVVITDGALVDPESLVHVALPVKVIEVGNPVENTAIVRVDVRRGKDPVTQRPQVQAFALVANFGQTTRDLFITLRPRNVTQPLASRRLELAPGERTPVVLDFEPAPSDAGMGLVFELSPNDAMLADDRAYGRVPVGKEISVVVAPKSASPWFVRALQADPFAEVLGTTLEELASADVPHDALVVIEGACPNSIPGTDFVLLNPPVGTCQTIRLGEHRAGPAITSWNEADPRLRFLTLDGVQIQRARQVELESPGDSLVRAQEGTVIADISAPGRTGTLIAFDVGESNWPLKASFVLFVRNLVEVTRDQRARGVTAAARTGQPLQLRVPPDVEELSVLYPDGSEHEVIARMGLAVVPEARRAGFYHVSWQGKRPGSVLVATNLVDAEESDLRHRDLQISSGAATAAASANVEAFVEWGWIVSLVALVFLVLDVWWLTRRPRRSPDMLRQRPRLPNRSTEAIP